MACDYKFDVESSKDGFEMLRIHKNNKKIYIGSKYNMNKSIDDFLRIPFKYNKDSIFVIFGIGSGEGLRKFCYKYNENKIIILEPNLQVRNYVKLNKKKYSFIDSKRVFFIESHLSDLFEELSNLVSQYDIVNIKYKVFMNYDVIYNEEFKDYTLQFKNVMSNLAINRNTNIYFSETWFNTLIRNLKYIIGSTPIDFYKNKYKDVPAIIVSAGPSLSKNINELCKINKDIMILSGGRTLKPLYEKGISPDLLGIVDAGEASYSLVDGYIKNTKVPLLYYEGTNEKVVREHKGDKLVFTQGTMIEKILQSKITNVGRGGSVAHTLTATAILLGCNPIIFIGQDLAYTNEKYHADIAINQFASLEENLIVNNENEDNIYVEAIYGGKVKTSPELNSFRLELEYIIKQTPDVKFINATEGGAKINGTINMTLKDALEKYGGVNEVDFFKENRCENNIYKSRERTLNILKESIESIKSIIKCSDKALQLLRDLKSCLKKDNYTVSKISIQLDKIDIKIKKEYQKLEILNALIYPLVYTILSSSRSESEDEVIEKNKFMYEAMRDTCKKALKLLGDAEKEIKIMEM